MITQEELSKRVDAGFDVQLGQLAELVSIPSVSSDPASEGEVLRAAEMVRSQFEALGFDAEIRTAPAEDGTPGRPAVLAKSPVKEGLPTVLLYAHHDVQPAGDPSKWSSAPFEMEVRDGRAYGRGTSDDGAGVVVHMGVVRAFEGDLPVNLVVFVEGEEEVGSPSFTNFLEKYHEELDSDVIVVADSGNWTVDTPGVTSSLRGVATVDVTLKVLDHAVHSGMFGGPILDAVTLASRLITTLHNENGDVAVKGLGGDPRSQVEWPESEFRKDASTVEGYRLAGTADLAAQIWTMPAISVIGLDATSVENSANAIIPECTFRLSLRTVPGTDTSDATDHLVKHLEAHRPFGAEMTVAVREAGPAYVVDLQHPVVETLNECLEAAWGSPAIAIGQGGSIPFVAEFDRAFPEAVVLVTGVEDPASNAHSEDESQSLKVLRNATLAEALLLAKLGNDLS